MNFWNDQFPQQYYNRPSFGETREFLTPQMTIFLPIDQAASLKVTVSLLLL